VSVVGVAGRSAALAACVLAAAGCERILPTRQAAADAPAAEVAGSPFAFFGARAGVTLDALRAAALREWWQPLECVPLPGGAHRCTIERVTLLAAGGAVGRVEAHADSTGQVTWVSFAAYAGEYDMGEMAAEVEGAWNAAGQVAPDSARSARRWTSADGRWAGLVYANAADGRPAGFASVDLPAEARLLARYGGSANAAPNAAGGGSAAR
jgi:hypothetical protein